MFTCPPLLFDGHASSGKITNLYIMALLVLGVGGGGEGWTLQQGEAPLQSVFPMSSEYHRSFKLLANLQPICIFFLCLNKTNGLAFFFKLCVDKSTPTSRLLDLASFLFAIAKN